MKDGSTRATSSSWPRWRSPHHWRKVEFLVEEEAWTALLPSPMNADLVPIVFTAGKPNNMVDGGTRSGDSGQFGINTCGLSDHKPESLTPKGCRGMEGQSSLFVKFPHIETWWFVDMETCLL